MLFADLGLQRFSEARLLSNRSLLSYVAYVIYDLFIISLMYAMPVTAVTLPTATASEKAQEELIWLQNDQLKVGLSPSSGGAIAWISAAGADRSLINSFDRGRLVQQSWYGKEDGSLWNKTPWRWNPVQGGDWRGKSAVILEQKHEPTTSWVKSQPLHWASGELLSECTMEQTITLKDELLHIRFRFHYAGTEPHPAHHQELPAFFVDSRLATLVFYDGDAPWTGAELKRTQPEFPNEYKKITEHWAAYVGEDDQGIGCYVPVADELTCYRYGKDAKSPSSCSYFAPIRTMAVVPGFQWDYDAWITLGASHEIRERFEKISREKQASGDRD
jgi:hypothetical protein